MLVDAGGPKRADAGPDRDLAALEVAKEFLPLLIGGHPVFLAGPQASSAGQERQVGLDGLLGIDR